MENILLGAQVRMARAALQWSIADLAMRAEVGISTVRAIEAVDGPPVIGAGLNATRNYRADERATRVAEAIAGALVAGGVTLLPDDGRAGPGIRAKPRRARK